MPEPSRIALLNEELEQVRTQRESLRTKHRGDTMPAEARAEDEELVNRANRITTAIEIERQKERDNLFNETARYMDDPQYQVPRAVNADDEGRKIMGRHGWDFRNGMVVRETSLGPLDFCPEEVLFGPVPSDADDAQAAKYYKQTRAIFQPEYRAAYVKWLRAGGRQDSMAFASLSQAEQNALSSGTGESGGFLVPPDVQSEMLVRLAARSVMRRLARVIPTSSNVVQFPAVKPADSPNGSIYSSGFVGTVVGETPAFAENDPKFEQFEIGIKKFRTSTKLSNDWLADAAANMLAFLAENGAENLALVEDYYFINGLGTALEPRGILNSGLGTHDVEGTTGDTISNTTSGAGSAPKIDALPYVVPDQYAENGQWLMRRSIEGKIRALVDGNGRPWWIPQAQSGGAPGSPAILGGHQVNNSEFMPADGTNGNQVLVFGDFRAYIIASRAEISSVVLRERFADTDQTGIILFSRAGGGLWNTDALRVGIV